MKNLCRDLFIFAVIAGPISAILLNLDIKDGCVERQWSKVFYSSPVQRSTAEAVANAMVKTGIFAPSNDPGVYFSTLLTRNDKGVYKLSFIAERDYATRVSRDLFVNVVTQACNMALEGQTVNVWLVDRDLKPFDELVETQLFDPSAATANYE